MTYFVKTKWAKQTMKNESKRPKVPWKFQILLRISSHLHWSSFQFQLFDKLRVELLNIISPARRMCSKVGDDAPQRILKLRHYPHQSSDTLTIYWTTKQRVGQLRSSHLKETRTKTPPQAVPTTNMSSAYCLACVLLMILLSTLEVESYSVPNSPVSRIRFDVFHESMSKWLSSLHLY